MSGKRMLVLLVDDNPDDRAMVRRGVLREIPNAVFREAGTSDELDQVLAESEPKVAIVDFSLGWSDGFEVLRRIRATHPDCGVVLFTGSLGEDGAVEMMRAGLDDYVLKDPARLPRLAASVSSLARRVDERRARRRAEARHAVLFQSAGVGMFACRPDGGLVEANPALRRMLGVGEAQDVTALNIFDYLRADGLRAAWDASDGPAIQGMEVSFADGRSGAALLDAHTVSEADGEVEGVLTDVTALRAAVDRGNLLLREVYHRVYNNLQIVDAFLTLQARRFPDPMVKVGFQDVGERIRALAMIQQRLHRGEDFETLDFAGYLRDLTEALASVETGFRFELSVGNDPVRLPIDTAIPLGLIAVELLTNACKHAFPGGEKGGEKGRITVTLQCAGAVVRMSIADEGAGAPSSLYERTQGGGIGSLVVPQLAKQIRADLAVMTDGGTSVLITIPVATPERAS